MIRNLKTVKWVALATLLIGSSSLLAKPLLIAGTPEPPFKMQRQGRITGIDVDIVKKVLDELAIAHEFQLISSGARLIEESRLGRIDMVLSFSYKPERAVYLEYPQQSYKRVAWNFFLLKENSTRFQFEKMDDLRSARIGAVNAWAYTPEFWNSGLNITTVSRHTLLIEMLLRKRIDMAPMNTVETLFTLRQLGLTEKITYLPTQLASRSYFNVFSKQSNHPDLEKLRSHYDFWIEKLQAEGEIDKVYAQYVGEAFAVE